MKTEELTREITIKINDNSYEVKFPDLGQLVDMRAMKDKLTQGTYNSILRDSSAEGYNAALTVDMIATFSILIPKLRDDMNIKNFANMNFLDAAPFLSAYEKQFLPWYNGWWRLLNSNDEEGGIKEKSPTSSSEGSFQVDGEDGKTKE